MENRELFPAENIAFYNEGDGHQSRRPRSASTSRTDQIDIYAFGPWQKPSNDPLIYARYVIGHSREGYHWDTEFVFCKNESCVEDELEKSCFHRAPNTILWSSPYPYVDHAIKHARRCIVIQTKNFFLDTEKRVRLQLDENKTTTLHIKEIPLVKDLVFSLNKDDLQRVAIFNGYLSWHEFENGTVDLSL